MARTKTSSVVEDAFVENTEEVVETTSEVTEEKMNENNKKTATKKTVKSEPLDDYDEIEVISLIPNVSYKDNKTGDMYEWDKVDHVEYMTFETLKNMWRGYKGYFNNMWLKPNDDRVMNKFGLTKKFNEYEYLMDASNYTRKNIDSICKSISNTPNSLKRAICNKIKDLVINGEITDVSVVRKLEKKFDLDLIDFL